MNRHNECMEYFGARGFKRALDAIYSKYKSLGRIGGNIIIEKLREDERETLGKFLRQDIHKDEPLTIDVKDFERKFNDTRFEEVGFLDMLEGVLKRRLITGKKLAEEEEQARAALLDSIEEQFRDDLIQSFLDDIKANPIKYKIVYGRMAEKDKLKMDLLNVCRAVNTLPQGLKESLPVFAARIASDPHYFDMDTEQGKLLLKALSFKSNCEYPENAEDRAELLYSNGIMVDELSNTVLIYGLDAYGKGCENPIWKSAKENKQPLVVSLYNLNSIESIKSTGGFVVVVENPSVMAVLIHELPGISCICTSGMPNIAGLQVLSLIHESGDDIYYSGDFDPEGVLIADKLWRRFPDIKLLCFDKMHYTLSISGVIIDDKRIKKLSKLQNEGLQRMAGYIKETALAGYQEKIIKEILQVVKGIIVIQQTDLEE